MDRPNGSEHAAPDVQQPQVEIESSIYIYISIDAQQLIWHVRQVAGSPPTLCSRWAAPGQVKEQTIGLKLVPIQCLGTTRTANYVRGTKQ